MREPVILANEPSAPLDSAHILAVMGILNDMARKYQTAIIVVAHDERVTPGFRRTHHIRDEVTHEEAEKGRPLNQVPH